METITNLIKDTPIPKMVKVRQNFDKTCIPESDIPGIITRELDRPEIGGKILPGQKIAITCGSRGINHNALMARTIVDFVKSKGAAPYIVAAMGSHGHHIPVVRPPLRMQNRMVQPFGTCVGRTSLPPVFPLVRNAAARMARLFVDGLPDRSTHTVLPQSFLKQSREIVCT